MWIDASLVLGWYPFVATVLEQDRAYTGIR